MIPSLIFITLAVVAFAVVAVSFVTFIQATYRRRKAERDLAQSQAVVSSPPPLPKR